MTKDISKRAVIYCRVSSKSQEEEGHGLKSQETRCRDYARSKGYEVEAVFPDTITGGGDFMKRPGMKALLSYLDAQPDESYVVIFDDLKRFARDTRFHLDLREAFKQRNARIECLNFKFDDTPEGEFIETIMAAQGALERKQNGRQVAQKMKARMQSGYWIHNAPIGYRYTNVKGRGKLLIPDEPFASIIKEAFEGYASGRFQSQVEVKRFLEGFSEFPKNRYGKVTRKKTADILNQSLYTGYICSENYNLNWIEGQHEALISLETFDKVQERKKSASKAPARKNIGNSFALRGFVLCGDCETPLYSCWSKGKTKSYPYYLCQTKACKSYGKSIPRDRLENDVGELVKSLQPSNSLVELVKIMFQKAWDQRLTQAEEKIVSARKQIEKMDKQIDGLLDRIINATNETVIGSYEAKLSELERNKSKLEQQSKNQLPQQNRYDEFLELSLKFFANPWKLWESGQITLRRTVLRLAFQDRLVYHRNGGTRTPKTALIFNALRGDSNQNVLNGAG